MYKLSCDLCYVTRFLRLRLVVIYKDKFNKEKVSKINVNGNDYLTVKTYPYLTLEISNEEEKKETWTYQKSITLDRFGMFNNIDRSQPLLRAKKKKKDMF